MAKKSRPTQESLWNWNDMQREQSCLRNGKLSILHPAMDSFLDSLRSSPLLDIKLLDLEGPEPWQESGV